jgi:hypothetical protein
MRIPFISSSLMLSVLIAAPVAEPLEAKGVGNVSKASRPSVELDFQIAVAPEDPQEEDIVIPIWIPGFDDVEPELACSLRTAPKAKKSAGMDACGGTMRMVPWISHPAPVRHQQFLLPML